MTRKTELDALESIKPRPLSEEDRARARSVVESNAKDDNDRRILMEILGLEE